jgi:hypothetical protein
MSTRIYLDAGHFVLVTGDIDSVIANKAGWINATDPDDGRRKLIRAERILWIEEQISFVVDQT